MVSVDYTRQTWTGGGLATQEHEPWGHCVLVGLPQLGLQNTVAFVGLREGPEQQKWQANVISVMSYGDGAQLLLTENLAGCAKHPGHISLTNRTPHQGPRNSANSPSQQTLDPGS